MSLSYIEEGDSAGFGQYPYERLGETSLYYTQGVVANAIWNDISIADSASIVEWIASRQLPDGSFDDPSVDIPALNETWWAIQTLQLLDADSSQLAATVPFLESCVASRDLSTSQPDIELKMEIFDAYTVLRCVEAISGAGLSVDPALLGNLRTSLEALTPRIEPEIEASPASWDMSDPKYNVVSAYCMTLALVAPESLPIAARQFLISQLSLAELAPADFAACARIVGLLIASIRVFDWESIPQDIQDSVWAYLEERVFPIVSAIGGFGWNGADGTRWLDAHMTLPLIELCHLLGRAYPFASMFSQRLSPLRTASGWGYNVQLSRDAGNSYLALGIAQKIGWSGLSHSKMLTYFRDTVRAVDSTFADITYAARGWASLAGMTPEMRSLLVFRLREASAEQIRSESPAVLSLMYEFRLSARETGLGFLLEEVRSQLLQRLAASMRMDLLWQLCEADALLGEESLGAGEVTDFVAAQQLANGGFRMAAELPEDLMGFSDVVSTYLAIEILMYYDVVDVVPRDSLASFIEECRYGLGYLIAPIDVLAAAGDPLDVDFFSTYYGIRLQHFAETGSL